MSFLKKISLFSLFSLFFWSLASSVLSAGSTQINWPDSPLTNVKIDSSTELHELIAYLYGWGIGVGGVLLFAILIIAGIEYMTSEAAGNPSLRSKAVGRISSAALGLVLLLSAFLILNTINPQITTLRELPPLWDTDLLSDITTINQGIGGAPPCEFAYLYSGKNRTGSRTRVTPNTYYVPGNELPYDSGEGFAKMSEGELDMFGKGDTSFAGDREIIDGLYIESPGSCTITVYYTPSFFVTSERQMGTITLPNDEFTEIMWEEKSPSSYELRNTGIGN